MATTELAATNDPEKGGEMRMARILGILAALGLILAAAGGAHATSVFELVGDPYDGGSWNQQAKLSGASNVDEIWAKVEPVTAGTVYFANPGILSMPTGWAESYRSGLPVTIVEATTASPSPGPGDISFKLSFEPATKAKEAADFSLYLAAYNSSGYLVASQVWSYDSDASPSWQPGPLTQPGDPAYWDPNPAPSGDPTNNVPEPLTLAGLVLGLGCLASYIRKRR
jgi:hypothetical protein